MPDELEQLMMTQSPTMERPLLGLTVLVVEDSLYACEAMRLLCLRSGARIRRADSLKSAHRHLAAYRPTVVIVDLGLPDGSGAELIRELSTSVPQVGVLLAISGDMNAREIAMSAGANGFLEKPLNSLSAFQSAVLDLLPIDKRPKGLRHVTDDHISPDPMALQEDLAHVADLIADAARDPDAIAYVAQFLSSIASLAQDHPLAAAAKKLDAHSRDNLPIGEDVACIAELVQQRLLRRNTV